MKFLAISDHVEPMLYSSAIKHFSDVDFIISCGDLPKYYLDFIISMLNKPLYYVKGNHYKNIEYTDYGGSRDGIPGGINLDNKMEHAKGISLLGFEGCRRYNSDGVQYTEAQMKAKVFRAAPVLFFNKLSTGRHVDIIVTHAPPLDIHDREDNAHRGFNIFRSVIERYKPKYFLHGHSHMIGANENRVTNVNGTIVVNTYGHIVLEI